MCGGRLALRRARWRSPSLVVAAVVTFLATTLVAVVTAYLGVVADAGVASALDDGADPRLVTTVTARAPGPEATAAQATLDVVVTDALRAAAQRSGALVSDSFGVAGRPETDLVVLVSYADPAQVGRLVDGVWPGDATVDGAVPVALPVAAAEGLGLRPGDPASVAPRTGGGGATQLRVVGTYEPDADALAVGSDLERTGRTTTDFSTYGPLVAAPTGFATATSEARVTVRVRMQPGAADLRPQRLSALAAAIDRLDASMGDQPDLVDGALQSSAPALLRAVDEQLRAVRAEVVLPGIGLAVLAGVALVVVAAALAEGSRRDRSVLRARGASRGALVGLALTEAAVVALPAAVLGPPLAAALVARWTGSPVRLPDLTTWTAALVVVALSAAVLALPASRMPTAAEDAAAAARGPRRTQVAQAGLDLALVVLAVAALWQLRSSTEAGGAVDVLLVAAPALGVLAGALLVPRLVGLLARLAERRSLPGRRLAPALTATELGRRPRAHAATAVLVATALAVVTLSLAYDRSWERTAVDQARQRTGADVRLTVSPSDLPALAELAPGAATVARVTVALGGVRATMLAVDLEQYGQTSAAQALLGSYLPALTAPPTTPPPNGSAAVPALVSAVVAESAGLEQGRTVGTSVSGLRLDLQVTAVARQLPTAPTDEPVLLVDSGRLAEVIEAERTEDVRRRLGEAQLLGFPLTEEQVLADYDWQPPEPTELWAASDDPPALAARLRDAAPPQAVVEDRVSLVERLRSDPLTSAGLGAGRVALGAAAVLVLLGFAGQVVVTGLRRAPDLAVLRALGVARSRTVHGLAGEQSLLGALAAACGVAVGVAVALVTLPALLRSALLVPGSVDTATGMAPQVVVPWAVVGLVLLAGVVALAFVALVAARAAQRPALAAQLRQREER